ncbi:Pecanex-like protein 1 [Pseudonocardia broussonetiae]|uniref:Pecanex-like protein 1 n=1 Tax=Pseudonocardia broussonetiae TaxID=2736640 RepID=A0A6M6JPC5_9PSEU|nr:Pecanex-like protein 1 [Pseudonocardia broussonetiae]QJY48289.1 Pecanex-like protein 1 [Pseudonocardia broussonetiae]
MRHPETSDPETSDTVLPDPTLPENSPSARARRAVLTIMAAAAVVLLPTACDYAIATPTTGGGGYGQGAGQGAGGHSGHAGGSTSTIQTVPAGNTQELEPTTSAEEAPAEETTSAQETTAAEETTSAEETTAAQETTDAAEATTTTDSSAPAPAPPAAGGLEILGDDCTTSELAPHTGFQDAPRCVAIAFGEVAAAAQSPSLLITDAPQTVAAGEAFTLEVSTRNLVRDRFLGAAAGGYYRESSFLTEEGIQRGHFHTACRMLDSVDVAPDAEPAPAFFLATQDNGGGAEPDVVTVPVNPMPGPGTAQCAVWAGDGSHRIPMMQRANQTPAMDVVRIVVE